jgi:hypothetical protein
MLTSPYLDIQTLNSKLVLTTSRGAGLAYMYAVIFLTLLLLYTLSSLIAYSNQFLLNLICLLPSFWLALFIDQMLTTLILRKMSK